MSEYELPSKNKFLWKRIQKRLTKQYSNCNQLENLLEKFLGDFKEAKCIGIYFKEQLNEEEKNLFFQQTLPFMQQCALLMPKLFPTHTIKRLVCGKAQSITFTRQQICCLLCHMFFCTLQVMKPEMKYWCTFEPWITCNGYKPVISYFHSLFNYFYRCSKLDFLEINQDLDEKDKQGNKQEKEKEEEKDNEKEKEKENEKEKEEEEKEKEEEKENEKEEKEDKKKNEKVKFQRNVIKPEEQPSWLTSELELIPIHLIETGIIGKNNEQIQVEFANKDIGFGISGTQEEIVFGMNIELCISMLICDTMKSNEAILIQNSWVTGVYKGYGLNVEFIKQPKIDPNNKNRMICAIDALELEYFEDYRIISQQLQKKNILHELNKAYCGFAPNNLINHEVATGHWGCGAFGGDKEIKAIIQYMAASQCQASKINYYCFSDNSFIEKFQKVLQIFKNESINKVSQLWVLLRKFHELFKNNHQNNSFFDLLIEKKLL
ncbi:poly adp-ribose glycohydrolase [Anaeramoeba flamelloides]|uniref:poly(ADP-ribose) glycohydrolase n=1 Tax=Anaeramoeba flamelloides TaxID=1746091 RepID=A0AAV7YHJ6_9EUKA|nr:poly adp-ribose glycohydrolase [Anaeramoeba flamelloides]